MQVICKDGTAIQCDDFEAVDSGVLLFQGQGRREMRSEEDEEEEEEEERRATGFVPITELKFVLPDELVGGAGQRAGATERGRGTPPGAPTAPGGQVAQQQQMQQQPGAPRQGPYDMGGQ
ncbi:hypothetical protein ACFQMA_25220 [Halosimplex aquaticum]|uniref:Uncharacterized protein n=1 Tax=Halosimplex aquaticum TaxID=3026162 RepID=A0ABD5Y6F5_9EURY